MANSEKFKKLIQEKAHEMAGNKTILSRLSFHCATHGENRGSLKLRGHDGSPYCSECLADLMDSFGIGKLEMKQVSW